MSMSISISSTPRLKADIFSTAILAVANVITGDVTIPVAIQCAHDQDLRFKELAVFAPIVLLLLLLPLLLLLSLPGLAPGLAAAAVTTVALGLRI